MTNNVTTIQIPCACIKWCPVAYGFGDCRSLEIRPVALVDKSQLVGTNSTSFALIKQTTTYIFLQKICEI